MNADRYAKTLMYVTLSVLVLTVYFSFLSTSGHVEARTPPTPTPATQTLTLLKSELGEAGNFASNEWPTFSTTPIRATAVISVFSPIADAEVIQGYPTSNCGDSSEMHAGYDTYLTPDGRVARSLIQFNLAAIRPEATINDATLRVYLSSSYDYSGHSVAIRPYRATSPWAGDTVTWSDAPTIGESYPAVWITHGAWGWYEFDVTDLVRGWVNGTYPNYGLYLRGPESSAGWRGFATSEAPHSPQLVVNYDQSPDFDLTLVPNRHEVSKGQSVSSFVYLTGRDSFQNSITLSVTGLPGSFTHQWQTNPLSPTARTLLTITNAPDTPAGQYDFTVLGTSGSLTHSASGTVGVDVSLSPSFTNTIYLPLILKNFGAASASGAVSQVVLAVGASDYEHMGAGTSSRAGAPGNDLLYSDIDGINTSMVFGVRGGCCDGQGLVAGQTTTCNLKLLVDSQATKAAIHAAIVNWLDPLEDENTVVVIFFSGHGMYAPDDDGDENDPYDEFLVPYEIEWDDSQGRWRHEMAIRDDELNEWLSVLESQKIVILVDSCFSGGIIEAAAGEARGLPWQPSATAEVNAAQWQDGFAQDIQGPGRVILTASAEGQSSWEFGELQDGVFTYYLLEAFRSPSADANSNGWISAEEAYAYLAGRVDDYVWAHTSPPEHQNPQMSDGVAGEVDLIQLGGTVSACPSW